VATAAPDDVCSGRPIRRRAHQFPAPKARTSCRATSRSWPGRPQRTRWPCCRRSASATGAHTNRLRAWSPLVCPPVAPPGLPAAEIHSVDEATARSGPAAHPNRPSPYRLTNAPTNSRQPPASAGG